MFDLSIPQTKNVYLYPTPINLRWTEKKLTQIITEEMGLNVSVGKVFMFYNKKKDQLKVVFKTTDGWQEFIKFLPDQTFILPAPEEGKAYLTIDRNKLGKIFTIIKSH